MNSLVQYHSYLVNCTVLHHLLYNVLSIYATTKKSQNFVVQYILTINKQKILQNTLFKANTMIQSDKKQLQWTSYTTNALEGFRNFAPINSQCCFLSKFGFLVLNLEIFSSLTGIFCIITDTLSSLKWYQPDCSGQQTKKYEHSYTLHRWTDTHGCGAGLAVAKRSPFIDIVLFDTET